MATEAESGGVRASVLGINDGLVTNLSLILGVAGGSANAEIVKLAGLASLVAGACSMAVGDRFFDIGTSQKGRSSRR